MKKDDKVFLMHIRDNIEKIEKSFKNAKKEDYEMDVNLQDATYRRIEVIGEAVKNISAALKKVPIGYSNEGKAVTHYDAYVSFMNFWLTNAFGYPETVREKFIADLNASRKFNSFKWLEENADWAENERRKIGKRKVAGPLAFRNRAYRTPSAMQREAAKQGFLIDSTLFPLANPGKLDTGNVNWMAILRKKLN